MLGHGLRQPHGSPSGYGYRGHIRPTGEEKLDAKDEKRCPVGRWILERTQFCLPKWRAILVPDDKIASNYLALIQMARAPLWCLRQWQLTV